MILTDYFVTSCGCGSGTLSDSRAKGKCPACRHWYFNVKIEDCKDPDVLINAAEAELESANHHGHGSIPSKLFKAISPLVGLANQLDLAKAIVGAIDL